MLLFFSYKSTFIPSLDKLDAIVHPNIPPPTTATFLGNNTDWICSMDLFVNNYWDLFNEKSTLLVNKLFNIILNGSC